MSLKEQMFRKSIGEKEAKILQNRAPEVYEAELEEFILPDYILYDQFGRIVYSPEMAEEKQ